MRRGGIPIALSAMISLFARIFEKNCVVANKDEIGSVIARIFGSKYGKTWSANVKGTPLKVSGKMRNGVRTQMEHPNVNRNHPNVLKKT